jgi:HEPN domain-containing protein
MSGEDRAGLACLWFDAADHDLRIIQTILPAGLWAGACFHAQQCAEKSVKGLLVAMDIPLVSTESISDLLDLLEKRMPKEMLSAVPMEDMRRCAKLDRHYLLSRYPDARISQKGENDIYDQDDALDCLEKAMQIYREALRLRESMVNVAHF